MTQRDDPHDHSPVTHEHDHAHEHGHTHDGQDHPGLSTQILAAIWLILAALVGALIINGRISNYVRSFWWPFLGGVCLILIVLSLIVLWKGRTTWAGDRQPQPEPPGPKIAWLVLLPGILLIGAAPSPLGSSMLDNTTSAASSNVVVKKALAQKAAGGINFPALKDGEPNELTLENFSDRFNFDDPKKLEGKTITVIGFVSHQSTGYIDASVEANAVEGTPKGAAAPPADQPAASAPPKFRLNRFKIYCCAADAIAYSVNIVSDQDFKDDQWLKITGSFVPGQRLLTFKADTIEPITQPKVPYL